MKTYHLARYGFPYTVTVERTTYAGGNLAIQLYYDEGPFARLTVNLPESDALGEAGFAFIDTNNVPWAEQFLADTGLAQKTCLYAHSGYCDYPLYQFDLNALEA